MPLTAPKIKASQPKEKDYKLFDEKGLFLLIKKTGAKYWRLKYRYNGKEKLFSIGVYPEISLKDARLKRDEMRLLLNAGIDPMQQKKDDQARQSDNDFKSLTLEWIETNAWKESTRKNALSRFNNHVFPIFGSKQIDEVNRQSIINMIDRLKTNNMHTTTIAKVHGLVVSVYKYAIAKGVCERNLAEDLKPLLPKGDKVEHRKALARADIPLFLNKLDNYGGAFITVCALKLMVLTAARPSEVFKAVWADFDIENSVWIRPSERMKAKKEHPTPLSKQTIDVLNSLHRQTGKRADSLTKV